MNSALTEPAANEPRIDMHTEDLQDAHVGGATADSTSVDGPMGVDVAIEPLDPKRLRRNPLMSKVSWGLVALLVGCTGFAIGARVTKEQAPDSPFANLGGGGLAALAGGGGFPGVGAGGGLPDISALLGGGGGGTSAAALSASQTSSGEIVLISGGKIYIKMSDGNTKAISVSSGTTVSNASPSTVESLVVGQRVLVDGRTEASGVIAANAVVAVPPIPDADV
jgi:hypothetical protein